MTDALQLADVRAAVVSAGTAAFPQHPILQWQLKKIRVCRRPARAAAAAAAAAHHARQPAALCAAAGGAADPEPCPYLRPS